MAWNWVSCLLGLIVYFLVGSGGGLSLGLEELKLGGGSIQGSSLGPVLHQGNIEVRCMISCGLK